MNTIKLKQINRDLARHFHVRPAKLNFITGKRSWYRTKRKTIDIGTGWKNHFSHEESLLHEFAHHLESCRNNNAQAEKATFHGAFFVRCLVEVTDHYYGDRTLYSWDKEYKQVQRIYYDRHIEDVEPPIKSGDRIPMIEQLLSSGFFPVYSTRCTGVMQRQCRLK